MQVPWARTGSRFTRRFEDEVAWFLQRADQTATSQYFGIAWESAGRIARRVVEEKLAGRGHAAVFLGVSVYMQLDGQVDPIYKDTAFANATRWEEFLATLK